MNGQRTILILIVVLTLVLAGCASEEEPESSLSPKDRADIYAAAVRQLYTVDHTFGEAPNFPVVYLIRTTDDAVGDPDAPQGEPQELPAPMQETIVDSLKDLPAEFIWVDSAKEVPRNPDTGTVEGGGTMITLGNIHPQDDGSVLVSAHLFFSTLGAIGKTYVVEQIDGRWQVSGDTGVELISQRLPATHSKRF